MNVQTLTVYLLILALRNRLLPLSSWNHHGNQLQAEHNEAPLRIPRPLKNKMQTVLPDK